MRLSPGVVRDSIVDYLNRAETASLAEIQQALSVRLGDVPPSSVRSYLNLNTPRLFERADRGHYRLRRETVLSVATGGTWKKTSIGQAQLFHADCFEWLKEQPPNAFHAVVTDPPYGLLEYTDAETQKLRAGRGGVWRIPPSFDGHARSPLPRFTVLNDGDRAALQDFFYDFGRALLRVLVPGANVVVASNPLLSHIVAAAMSAAGLEVRGYISRLTMTMRGGDRPKNAHKEFDGVSVMPRSMFEPWVVVRKPLDGRVQDNLRKWGTGGFRRPGKEQPFGDVIQSRPTLGAERRIAPHPSLKPQEFLRTLVRGVLPLGEGVVLDPFAGSGSTLAAANAIGYSSIGVERDADFFRMAQDAIPKLATLKVNQGIAQRRSAAGNNGQLAEGLDGVPHQEGG